MKNAMESATVGARRWLAASTVYQYLYCMAFAHALDAPALAGGAMFLCMQAAVFFLRALPGGGWRGLSHRTRRVLPVVLGLVLAAFGMLCMDSGWRAGLMAALLQARMLAGRALTLWCVRGALGLRLYACLSAARHIAEALAAFALGTKGVCLWLGFWAGAALEGYAVWRARGHLLLDAQIAARCKNHYGVKLIIQLLRPLYAHRLIGMENLEKHENGSLILICNHGEIYGPVAAHLCLPHPFRPWVFSRMMDREEIIEHMYFGTMERQKWLPESWKRPILHMIAPFLCWLFESLESIPVYRGRPRDLLKTFRLTLEAMQNGENMLVFPEDADEHEEGKSGFVRDGVGKLYTGFAMLGPMLWAKAHRQAVFVPIYADKRKRTFTIGEGVIFDPQNNANDEKLRIVDELLCAMRGMAAGENAETTVSV